MKAEEIKVGETYVDEYDSERTVVEIRPGIPKSKRNNIYVRYTTDGSDRVNMVRLSKFASWANSPKIDMPLHKCEQMNWKREFKIKHNVSENHWMMMLSWHKEKIAYCPFCGIKLPVNPTT